MKKNVFFDRFLFLLLIFALPACLPYVLVKGRYTASLENFEVDLPDGWRKHDLMWDHSPMSKSLLEELQKRRKLTWDIVRITKDGLALQQIAIGRVATDEELPHTKKKLSKGMLPQEVAEVFIDNIRSNPNITNQQFTENTPATVGGYPGFKLLYTYRTKQGLKIKRVYYGVMLSNWCYYLIYEAPASHYFAKDYPVFEKVKDSFRILKADTV